MCFYFQLSNYICFLPCFQHERYFKFKPKVLHKLLDYSKVGEKLWKLVLRDN